MGQRGHVYGTRLKGKNLDGLIGHVNRMGLKGWEFMKGFSLHLNRFQRLQISARRYTHK